MSLLPLSSSSVQHSDTRAIAIASWALPFENGECGPDLEYDNTFLELQQAARGKPETQFEPATAPDWNAVETGSLALLQKSRDLRLLVLWAESQLNLKGLASLPGSLHNFANLLDKLARQPAQLCKSA